MVSIADLSRLSSFSPDLYRRLLRRSLGVNGALAHEKQNEDKLGAIARMPN
jgi:hypothetical protein